MHLICRRSLVVALCLHVAQATCPAQPGLSRSAELHTAPDGDAILTHSHTGAIVIDGVRSAFTEIGFDVVEDDEGAEHPAVIALFDGEEGYVIIPIDIEHERPVGEVFLVRHDRLWVAESPKLGMEVHEFDDTLTAEGVFKGEDGEGESAFTMTLSIGAGSSRFELEENIARLNGDLGSGTHAQVRYLIEHHPEIDTIVFEDVPGSVNDEVNVLTGRLIRGAGYTTVLGAGSVISSGGVDLFLAGKQRIVSEHARIGVHSWGDPSGEIEPAALPRDHPAHAHQVSYFSEIMDNGVEFYFYTLEAADFEDIHWMTRDEIERWGIATE